MYTVTPNQSLMTWALAHGWCSQRCEASTIVETDAPNPIGGLAHRSAVTARAPIPSGTQIADPGLKILVVHGGQHGRACSAAEAIAEAADSRGLSTLVRSVDEATPADVSAADAVIAGCWVPGREPLSNEMTLRMMGWIQGLAPMSGKPVGLFCTYRFFPYTFADMATRTARMENELAVRFERKGARIVAMRSIHFKSIDEEAAGLVRSLIDHVRATEEPDTSAEDLQRTNQVFDVAPRNSRNAGTS